MRKSIATVCLGGSPPEKLSAAAQAGFHGLETFEEDLLASCLGPEEILAPPPSERADPARGRRSAPGHADRRIGGARSVRSGQYGQIGGLVTKWPPR
jgi:hypothetical protein